MNPDRRWSEFNTSNDLEYRKQVKKDRKFLGIEEEDSVLNFNPSEFKSLNLPEDSLFHDSIFIPAASEEKRIPCLDVFERFELYSIEVEHVEEDRNFLTIHIDSPFREQTIYRRNENEEIPICKPLVLSGPFRPMLSSDPIFIRVGDHKWRWEVYKFTKIPYNPNKVHPEGVITESISDISVIQDSSRIPSCVTIRYEWLNESVEANFLLKFAYYDLLPCNIEIISGRISVTTNGRSETERVLRFFPVKKKKTAENDNRRFWPGDIMLLDRGIIAMPINSELHVSVDLVYCVYWDNDEERITERKIKGSRSIKVPKNPGVSKLSFSDDDSHLFPTLNLEVDWSDEIYPFLLCSGRKKIPTKSEESEEFEFFPDPSEA